MKNQITIEQLQKDGIAQLKTKQKMVKEGILKNLSNQGLKSSRPFIGKDHVNTHFVSPMEKMFGRSFKIDKFFYTKFSNGIPLLKRVGLIFKGKTYYWPVEAIEK